MAKIMTEAQQVIDQVKATEKELDTRRAQYSQDNTQLTELIKSLGVVQAEFAKISQEDWDQTPKIVQDFVKRQVVVTGNTIQQLQKMVVEASGLLVVDKKQAEVLIAALQGLVDGVETTFGGAVDGSDDASSDDGEVEVTASDK